MAGRELLRCGRKDLRLGGTPQSMFSVGLEIGADSEQLSASYSEVVMANHTGNWKCHKGEVL